MKQVVSDVIAKAPLIVVLLMLLVGFVLLIKGADFFVEGSSSVAKRLKVPSVIIGLTIVAMGTSLPETAVSVSASMTGNNAMAISNAIGSNIFNLMVVIGVCGLIATVPVDKDTLFVDLPFSGICALLLVLLGALGIGAREKMVLGRLGGVVMLLLFAGYLFMMLKRVKMHREAANEDAREDAVATAITEETDVEENRELMPVGISLLCIVGGAAAIAFGGNLTVETASRIATDFGMSQTLVGLTIVSIGTSLPELVTSIVAARKNEIGMALGNAIGSNIFNILMVLGIASAVSPIALIGENIIDVIVLLVFSAIVWFLAYTRRKVDKKEGLLMLVLYLAFAIYICIR